jgi:hypothetical protein
MIQNYLEMKFPILNILILFTNLVLWRSNAEDVEFNVKFRDVWKRMPELSYLFYTPQNEQISPMEAMDIVIYRVANPNVGKAPVSIEEGFTYLGVAQDANSEAVAAANLGTDKGKIIGADDRENFKENDRRFYSISVVSCKFFIPKDWEESEVEFRLTFKHSGQV